MRCCWTKSFSSSAVLHARRLTGIPTMTNSASLEVAFSRLKISPLQRLTHAPVESHQQWKELVVSEYWLPFGQI